MFYMTGQQQNRACGTLSITLFSVQCKLLNCTTYILTPDRESIELLEQYYTQLKNDKLNCGFSFYDSEGMHWAISILYA